VLYRTAERLAGPAHGRGTVRHRQGFSLAQRSGLQPAAAGVIDFVLASLARSRLHQSVFVMVMGTGLAILIGQIATALAAEPASPAESRAMLQAALAAPLLTSLAVALALRAAFLLPIDRAAAWQFRITEEPAARTAALSAVVWCFRVPVVISSLAVAAAVQPGVLGNASVISAALTVIASLGLVEVVVSDWNRIPFTCSYLPGKRVLAYNLGVLLAAYFVFVSLGARVLRWSLTAVPHALVVAALLSGGLWLLRRTRLMTWGVSALDFEDYDPMAVRSLGLLPDDR
jgi:hypothetical protein